MKLPTPGQAAAFLTVVGFAGVIFALPAVSFLGDTFLPHRVEPVTTSHVAPLIGEAIWAKASGGRATELRPLEPFAVGEMIGCHIWAERLNDRVESDKEHEKCMQLMPAVEAVGYLSSVHLRSEGVWQDPRVPFAQIATMSRVSATWTKAQLVDTMAARGEFGPGFVGVTDASRAFFGRSPNELTVPQAALIGALVGTRIDPWCSPERAAAQRQRTLQLMHDNQVIDDNTLQSATVSELGLIAPPPSHKPCKS